MRVADGFCHAPGKMKRRHVLTILSAVLVTLPGLCVRMAGLHFGPLQTALLAGAAIIGASFLLLWACDAAQEEISQSLALAVVALLAVLPEYSVDMYFTSLKNRVAVEICGKGNGLTDHDRC